MKSQILALALLAVSLAGGCVRYAPLVEGRYAEVEPATIHAAGTSDREDLPAALAALLRARLDGHADATEEKAIEAAISLGRIGAPSDGAVLEETLRRDPSADVRYFAAEALRELDAERLRAIAPELLATERDPAVRTPLERATAP